MAAIYEKHRLEVGTDNGEEHYGIEGVATESEALALLAGFAPETRAGLYRGQFRVERIDDGLWNGRVEYSRQQDDTKTDEQKQADGDTEIAFEIGVRTEKIYQSLDTTIRAPAGQPAGPDFKGALNVKRQGKDLTVEGLDLEIPTYSWSETHYVPMLALQTHIALLHQYTGKINNGPWRNFGTHEVRFDGASGRAKSTDRVCALTYKFAACKSDWVIFGPDPADQFMKLGWDYVWFLYDEKVEANSLVRRVRAAYEEQVYPSADFAALGIG